MKTLLVLLFAFLAAIPSTLCEEQKLQSIERLPLKPEGRIPIVGLGTWTAKDEELEKALEVALEAGYRHIDTAFAYQNEHVIGKVLKKWFDSGKLKREDVFIVSKLPPSGNRPEGVEKFLKKSLQDLQLDYLDLYLIHAPVTFADVDGQIHPMKDGKIVLDTTTDHKAIWKEMEKQVDGGRTKAIGLSNFNETQILKIINNARIKPTNLQIELHAYLQEPKTVEFCKEHGIVVTAYSPLGTPGLPKFVEKLGKKVEIPSLFEDATVVNIAKKHGKTPAQVLLRHALQKGLVVIPKSTNPERIRQNLDLFGFSLDEEDMKAMNALNKNQRFLHNLFEGLSDHPEYPYKN